MTAKASDNLRLTQERNRIEGAKMMEPNRRRWMRAIATVLAVFATAIGTARAWDPDMHVTILDAACLLSGRAAAALPGQFTDEMTEALRGPDPFDGICRTHSGPQARIDPAMEAEKLYRSLTSTTEPLRPYQRARAVGAYLHYVADSVEPAAIASGRAVSIPNFFANKDFVIFRRPTSLTPDLAASLRAAGRESQAADDLPGSYSAIFRQAVNVTADAILALKGRSGDPSDGGPVVFVVNRLDNGLSATKGYQYLRTTYSYSGDEVTESYSIGENRVGGGGRIKSDMLKRQGVQVVEWTSKRTDSATAVTAMLFNNFDSCATDITVKAAHWTFPVSGTMGPHDLRLLSFEAPASANLDNATAVWKAGPCAPTSGQGVVPTGAHVVVEGGGIGLPRFKPAPPVETWRENR